ncbi:DMT family transporter [Fuscovulum blasticum]|uniref:DMT family transporter n=1 Tax=Fuscovulum blasticum TaxID=1075 RepID=UPI000D3E7B2D|nr:DMT family transporter [Fuscovulum blasticum]AWD22238.1 EamA family transporter [Fuscovulum blasticum]
MSPTLRGALLSLAAFGIYATHDVVVKTLGHHYSSFQIIFFSGLLSFPFVTVLLMSDKRDVNLVPRHPWLSLLRSVLAVVTGGLGFYAFSVLPMAQCYAMLFATPLLITLLSIPFLGEKVGVRRALAVIVGLIGVLIVLRPGSVPFSWGHLSGLGAALSGALASVIVRKIGKNERSIVLMMYPMLMSVGVMALTMPFVYRPMPFEHLALTGVISVFGMCGAALVIAAYRAAPAVVVAPMQYSQIIWAALYGWLFFDETIDGWTAVGSAVIILSGIYIVLREGTPSVSQNRPVLENRSRLDTGTIPRISLWLRRFGPKEG